MYRKVSLMLRSVSGSNVLQRIAAGKSLYDLHPLGKVAVQMASLYIHPPLGKVCLGKVVREAAHLRCVFSVDGPIFCGHFAQRV